MFMFPIVFVFILIAVVVFVNIARASQGVAAWKAAASQLRFANQQGGFLQPRYMQGTHDGFNVKVDTYQQRSGNTSHTYTRFKLTFPRSLALRLRLTSEGFLTGVTKVFGAQDIEVGSPSFDAAVLVKGADPDAVRAFLTPARRLRIQQFLRAHANTTIDDHGIQISRSGLVSDPRLIADIVQDMSNMAQSLLGDGEPDPDDVCGRDELEAPANVLSDMSRQGFFGPAPVEPPRRTPPPIPAIDTSMSTGEDQRVNNDLSNLARQQDEPHGPFAQGPRETSEEDDGAVSEITSKVPTRVPPIPQPRPRPERVERTPAPAEGVALDVASVCEALFETHQSSFATTQQFEERYQGRDIRWQGVLRRVERYHFDFVFKSDEGLKAVIEVHETLGGSYGNHKINATVQINGADAEALRKRLDQTVQFQGRLLKVDGFMHNIYVADGAIEP